MLPEFQPEFYPDHEKKLSLQPDVTATIVPACYEYPFDPKLSMSRSLSEHHYDVPHLSLHSGPQSSSVVPSTMSPTPSTSTQESCSSDKQMLSGSENSLSSSYPSTESTYNVATGNVRLPMLEAGNVARAHVNTRGALLVLPDAGISMSVPEGAVPKPSRSELHLAVLTEDRFRPQLPGLSSYHPPNPYTNSHLAIDGISRFSGYRSAYQYPMSDAPTVIFLSFLGKTSTTGSL